ncbi:MAG: DNA glycosylase AlkZ-like family protein [Fimbriimonas sp.]
MKLSKADARRALVRHHFATSPTVADVFHRLRSIQFDPIAPVGCNHDLVLQARVPGYKVGDWQKIAYEDRLVYDGWDKMASLVPFEGWPVRRLIYDVHRKSFEDRIFQGHKEAVAAVLREIEERGAMMPKDFEFQERRDDWEGTWFGPSVTKQVLRALWHAGIIMTAGRRKGQHIYDLTERVVPAHLLSQPKHQDDDARRELVMERHRAMGLLRPTASPEIWSNQVLAKHKQPAIKELVQTGEITPVEIEGMKLHATPQLLALLDQPSIERRVVFVAPLDPFMWDRKMIAHLFGFDYIWEIYTPEAKRRWGYYVLPVLYGDDLVARVEFFARAGRLEIRQWHWEDSPVDPTFFPAFQLALREFMVYCGTTKVHSVEGIDAKIIALTTDASG